MQYSVDRSMMKDIKTVKAVYIEREQSFIVLLYNNYILEICDP